MSLSTGSKNRILTFHFPQTILQKHNYRIGLLMIPFAIRTINATGTPAPTKIPVKTKTSLLSIMHQKLALMMV